METSSHYFKINSSGGYGYARWIKSRRLYRLTYYTPGGPVRGGYFESRILDNTCRRLKNKPTKKMILQAGW